MKLFLIIIFIILLFFIINLYLKKNFNEFFVTEESGLVCGKQNDICSVHNSTGQNSCCDGYNCILPKGDFQYKICAKNNVFGNMQNINLSPGEGLLNLGKFGLNELGLLNLKLPHLKLPSFEGDICNAIVGDNNINNSNDYIDDENISYFNFLDEEE